MFTLPKKTFEVKLTQGKFQRRRKETGREQMNREGQGRPEGTGNAVAQRAGQGAAGRPGIPGQSGRKRSQRDNQGQDDIRPFFWHLGILESILREARNHEMVAS